MNNNRREILFQKLWKAYVVIILGSIFFIPIISSVFSIIFVLTTAWYVFQNDSAQQRFDDRKKVVFLFSSLYWVAIIGLLWTKNENLPHGFATLETQLSILIFPLIFSFVEIKKKDILDIFIFLAFPCFLAFVLYIGFLIFNEGDNFSIKLLLTSFSVIAHRTYISLYFLTFGFILFIYYSKKSSCLEILIGYLFLLSSISIALLFESRIALLSIPLLMIVTFISLRHIKQKILLASIVSSLLLIGVILIIPNSERSKRLIEKIKTYSTTKQYGRVDDRFILWKKSTKLIRQNLFFGVGTGDSSYEILNFTTSNMVSLRYTNLHNQYLDILIRYGLFGFIPFILMLKITLEIAIKYNNPYYLIFLSVIFVFFLTESILIRQIGVMFYAIFNSMFYYSMVPSSLDKSDTIDE